MTPIPAPEQVTRRGAGELPTSSAPIRIEMMSKLESADEFAWLIRSVLQRHPDWLPDAIQGLFAGSRAALDTLNRERAASDAACLAALALCDTKRLTPKLQASLLSTITKPMHAPNLCELEKKFAASAIEAAAAGDTREAGLDPKDESAMPQADAQPPVGESAQ